MALHVAQQAERVLVAALRARSRSPPALRGAGVSAFEAEDRRRAPRARPLATAGSFSCARARVDGRQRAGIMLVQHGLRRLAPLGRIGGAQS